MVLIISLLTYFFMIILIIKKPTIHLSRFHIKTFFIPPVLGCLLILIFNFLPVQNVMDYFFTDSTLNPLKILILFLCVSLLSIALDELGFFNYIAIKAVNKFSNSQYRLFFSLYALIAILTIFTSNYIVILTFTPFICYFCKKANIHPFPYLMMEFIVANTYSMILMIGTPTNIYLSNFFQINFLDYLFTMFLPTICSGLISIPLFLILFNKDLKMPMSVTKIKNISIQNPSLTILTILHLLLCIILLAISSYIHIEIWLIFLVFALSLSIILIIYSFHNKSFKLIKRVYKRLPWSLIPFIISMFILIIALDYHGFTRNIAYHLNQFTHNNQILSIFTYGISSTICCNITNNIPMTLAFSRILYGPNSLPRLEIFATIIGSNLGAFLTPIGSLAGIMWMNILKQHKVNIGFLQFIKHGIIFYIPMFFIALFVLFLIN